MPVRDIERTYSGAAFDHPLIAIDGAIVHVRRPANRQGAAVAAMDVASGRALWETDLAVPPAGPPILDQAHMALTTANANGYLLSIDRKAIQRSVQDVPLRARGAPRRLPLLSSSLDLGDGKAAFASDASSPWLLIYDPANRRNPGHWLELPGELAVPPVAVASGMVAALQLGQVFYVDTTQADPLVAAFQPPLTPQQRVYWLPIGTNQTNPELADQCILADGRENIYRLRLQTEPDASLVGEAENQVAVSLKSRIAVVGELAYVGTGKGQLASFRLPSLELAESIELGGQAVWGPFVIGNQVVVATDQNEMICVDGSQQTKWKISLAFGEPIGVPLASADSILIAYRTGQLQKLDISSGDEVSSIATGQPLAAGPVRLQKRIVLTAHDSTLLVVDQP